MSDLDRKYEIKQLWQLNTHYFNGMYFSGPNLNNSIFFLVICYSKQVEMWFLIIVVTDWHTKKIVSVSVFRKFRYTKLHKNVMKRNIPSPPFNPHDPVVVIKLYTIHEITNARYLSKKKKELRVHRNFHYLYDYMIQLIGKLLGILIV